MEEKREAPFTAARAEALVVARLTCRRRANGSAERCPTLPKNRLVPGIAQVFRYLHDRSAAVLFSLFFRIGLERGAGCSVGTDREQQPERQSNKYRQSVCWQANVWRWIRGSAQEPGSGGRIYGHRIVGS